MLRFLFTEINYGGRVTDDKDRRLINSLILKFCSPEVLQDGYRFSDSGTYYMPECETVKQVRHACSRLDGTLLGTGCSSQPCSQPGVKQLVLRS